MKKQDKINHAILEANKVHISKKASRLEEVLEAYGLIIVDVSVNSNTDGVPHYESQ